MSAVVVLCRHGNTFNKGERVFWVGSREDLPLTAEGLLQSQAVAAALEQSGVKVARVLCGPLHRTKTFAEQICQKLFPGESPVIDQRLTELDYGPWSGLTDAEIEAQYGASALQGWRDRGVRPSEVSFLPPEDVVRDELVNLLEELRQQGGVSVAITSNGRLKELSSLLRERSGVSLASSSVSTGSTCILVHSVAGWHISGWNLKAVELAPLLRAAATRS